MSNGHKPTIILTGAEGSLIAKRYAQYAEEFRQARVVLNAKDRTEALRALDPNGWRIFCLRWNLCPPPDSKRWCWADITDYYIISVMHAIRLMVPDFSAEEKRFSAQWLTDNQEELPAGLKFVDGQLFGVVSGPGPLAQ